MTLKNVCRRIYFLLVFQDHRGASRRVDYYYKICSLVITTYLLSCVNSIIYIIIRVICIL